MDIRLLKIIVCPICKNKFEYNNSFQELICTKDNLAFPIKNGIPVLIKNKARSIL